MKQLILFDLDGVLLDSKENMRLSWARLQKTLALDISFDRYFALIGRPFRDILNLLDVTENLEEIERQYMLNSLEFMANAHFYPGTREVLLQFQKEGRKLGIVTSKDVDRTRIVLAQLHIRFDTVQTPGPIYRGKPAPDHLLLAMAETGTDPLNTVYIGDMDSDHQAANRAGIDYIHAAWGYGAPLGGAPSANTISDLAQYIP